MVSSSLNTVANQKAPPNKIFVVGEPGNLRELTAKFVEYRLVVEFYNGEAEFLAAYHPDNVGCVIVHHHPAAQSSLPILAHLKSAMHRMAIIIVAEPADIRLAVQATRAGAFDVLEKPVDPLMLFARIRQALSSLHEPIALLRGIDRATARANRASLTSRQRQILDMIVLGHPNKIIAADLGISQRTAENHRAAIMKRMGATSVAGLIQTALACE